MPRKQKKYHFIYKTVCLITSKFYYGMHSTNDLDDGYLGSGTYLWHSIRKYGRDNHQIEKLYFFSNREDLRKKEEQLVNEELLNSPLCMNLQLGGNISGFSSEQQKQNCHAGSKLKWQDPAYRKRMSKLFSTRMKKLHEDKKIKYDTFTGKKHSEKTKSKMSLSQKGKQEGIRNSQYGKCWIYNIEEKRSIKIKKEELDSYLNNSWLKGRKLKFK